MYFSIMITATVKRPHFHSSQWTESRICNICKYLFAIELCKFILTHVIECVKVLIKLKLSFSYLVQLR